MPSAGTITSWSTDQGGSGSGTLALSQEEEAQLGTFSEVEIQDWEFGGRR